MVKKYWTYLSGQICQIKQRDRHLMRFGNKEMCEFHVARFGERWLCDDLEKYQQEGIAEINVFSPEGGADADR